MTPVEERIDHDHAKRVAEEAVELLTETSVHRPLYAREQSELNSARAYLALLTEHSARDAPDIDLLVSWVRTRLVSRLPSALSEAADRLHAQLAKGGAHRMPNPSNSDLVGDALELSSRATPGPWTPYKGIDHRGSSVPKMIYAEDLLKVAQSFRPDGADAEFIAGARTLLPELAQQLEQAERDLERSLEQETEAHKRAERYREALARARQDITELHSAGFDSARREVANQACARIDAALTPDEGAERKTGLTALDLLEAAGSPVETTGGKAKRSRPIKRADEGADPGGR